MEVDERSNSKNARSEKWMDWMLKVADKRSLRVDSLQLLTLTTHCGADFVWKGDWAMKFKNKID